MVKIADWIWLANLDALLAEIQHMSGDDLDEGLLKILRDDIEASDTDDAPERWASAVFPGPVTITAWLGIDQGTDVLQVRLELPDELAARAETLFHVMQAYRLVR
ncbi:hypothetical protein [Rhizobium sp.]